MFTGRSHSLPADSPQRQPQLRLAEAILTASDELEAPPEKESSGEFAAVISVRAELILRRVGTLIARPGVGIGKNHLEIAGGLEETMELREHTDRVVGVLERVGAEDRTKASRLEAPKIVHVELLDAEATVPGAPGLGGRQLHSYRVAKAKSAQRLEPGPITTGAVENAQVSRLFTEGVLDEAALPLPLNTTTSSLPSPLSEKKLVFADGLRLSINSLLGTVHCLWK